MFTYATKQPCCLHYRHIKTPWTRFLNRFHNYPSSPKCQVKIEAKHFHWTRLSCSPPREWEWLGYQRTRKSEVVALSAKRNSDSDSVDAETLERELSVAIAEENYAEAAKIRDLLRVMSEDARASVLAANAVFYEAFRAGDLAAMQAHWAKTDAACCVHPGARGISGHEDVITSWEYVWANYEFPLDIELKDVKVRVRGDIGYVTCVELVRTKGSSWGGQFVTNIFERIDNRWLISVHHASPIDL